MGAGGVGEGVEGRRREEALAWLREVVLRPREIQRLTTPPTFVLLVPRRLVLLWLRGKVAVVVPWSEGTLVLRVRRRSDAAKRGQRPAQREPNKEKHHVPNRLILESTVDLASKRVVKVGIQTRTIERQPVVVVVIERLLEPLLCLDRVRGMVEVGGRVPVTV